MEDRRSRRLVTTGFGLEDPSSILFQDGRFQTLTEVVQHYDSHLKTGLRSVETDDLVQFLRSL